MSPRPAPSPDQRSRVPSGVRRAPSSRDPKGGDRRRRHPDRQPPRRQGTRHRGLRDSGDATASKLLDIGLDKAGLRGNAACWPGVEATASSEYSDDYPAKNVHDGCASGGATEGADWASDGELDPWVQLDWPRQIRSDRVVLSDRTTEDDVNGGVLTFSDGSKVEVGDIPAKGPVTVRFPMRTFDWVRFSTEGGTGYNNGLKEFEVHAVPSAPEAPDAVTASAA